MAAGFVVMKSHGSNICLSCSSNDFLRTFSFIEQIPHLRSTLTTSPQSFINLQHQFSSSIMDLNRAKNHHNPHRRLDEYTRSLSSHGNGKKMKMLFYFPLHSVLFLTCLTASLLILPLVLPPLPPPPYLLLLVPIFILGLLMVLAFMPSNVRHAAQSYA